MLLIYHGSNVEKRKAATRRLKASLLEKRAAAEVFEIDADDFTEHRLRELTGGRGLFEDKYIVFLFHILTTETGEAALLDRLEHMAAAEHIFVLVEDEIKKKHLKQLTPHAETVEDFSTSADESEYKPFSLSDAYGKRDKRSAWLELQAAWAADQRPESIHGVLAWQTRLMLLAKECDTAEAAGESGYPFKKAKGFQRNFTQTELEENFARLVREYHEAHRGMYDLDAALEQFLLEI